jgi:thioredoxin
MKNILLFVTISSFFGFIPHPEKHVTTSEIDFFAGSWSEAVAKAQEEDKPIFLDIYATWCGPCRLLKMKTFTNHDVVRFFNEHFINVSLDGEKGDGEVLANKYNIPGYPSLIIFDKNENPVFAAAGYMPPREFLKFGQQGLKKLKK